MLQTDINWTQIINLIIQLYLKDSTLCILWHSQVLFDLQMPDIGSACAIINIKLTNLEKSFASDIEDFQAKRSKFDQSELGYNALTEKLVMSIEKSHCESFLVFENEILPFIESFANASRYSVWRSKSNHFVFATTDISQQIKFEKLKFFEDQPNILLITTNPFKPDIFDLKINKFQGPKSAKQGSFLLVDHYFSSNDTFLYNNNLFPDKIRNLHGREVIVAGFDYRPYFVINYVKTDDNNSYDLAYGGDAAGKVQIDGTEARVLMTFCEIYNCKIVIDSSEADDWGDVFSNFSGDGSLGMVAKGTAEISYGAMYSWDYAYIYLDMSMYLVRSGITCVVPAPKRLASWLLPFEPFQLTLWLAVATYLAVETLSLSLTHYFESYVSTTTVNSYYESLRFGFVTTLKIFISQPSKSNIVSLTLRVLLFTCFINDIIITSIYGGGLASILTVPSYEEAADTVEGMLAQKLKWAANSEAWVSTIRNTDDHRMNGILKNFFLLNDEQLEKLAVTRSDFGFTIERLPFGHFAIGDYLGTESIDHLKIMKEDLYFQYTVAFTARCWPLLQQFDELIYWWHSAGLDNYWEWRVVADNMNVQKQKQVEATMYSNMEDIGPIKLGMSNFVGILLIWVLGTSVAFVVFLGELMEKYVKGKMLLKNKEELKNVRQRKYV